MTTTCIPWTGYKLRGYGRRKVNGRLVQAHRAAWEAESGPIPPGLTVHHRCGRTDCINVAHMELLTRSAHSKLHRKGGDKLSGNSQKTHCPHGHEYTKENTYIDSRGGRRCHVCKRQRYEKVR